MVESRGRTLVLLLTLAVVIRGAYLLEYAQLPFLDGPLYDSVVYLRQAQAVLSGHYGDATLLAYSPLYGYFLALTGVASSLLAPVLAQLALGVAQVALVFVAVRRRFGATAALGSALLWLGYGLLVFYESKLLSETLGLTLALAAFAVYVDERVDGETARRAPLWCVVAGALLGLAVLARASLLFSAPIFVAAAFVPRRAGERWLTALRRGGSVLAGVLIVLGGNGAWNEAHTGFFVPVTFVSDTVRVSASQDVAGSLRAFSHDGTGDVSPWDVVRQAETRLRHGPDAPEEHARAPLPFDVGGYLRHLPGKLWRSFSDLELSFFQYGYYGERSELRSLGLMPVSFGVFLLLGALGAFFLVRGEGWRALVPYAPYVLGALATTTLFHPDSRYRLAMIVPCAFLGGHAVASLRDLANQRLRAVAIGVVGLACALLVARTLTYRLNQPAVWELSVAESAAVQADAAEVARRVHRARAAAPGDPGTERRIAYVNDRLARATAAMGGAGDIAE